MVRLSGVVVPISPNHTAPGYTLAASEPMTSHVAEREEIRLFRSAEGVDRR